MSYQGWGTKVVFVICIISITAAGIYEFIGRGHVLHAGLHLLGAARNIHLSDWWTPFNYFEADGINISTYNHHPQLFFLIHGLIAKIGINKIVFLKVSRLISAASWIAGSLIMYIFWKRVYKKTFKIEYHRYKVLASIASVAPMFTVKLLPGLILMTTFDEFSYLLSSLILLVTTIKENRNKIIISAAVTLALAITSYYGILIAFGTILCMNLPYSNRFKAQANLSLMAFAVGMIFNTGLFLVQVTSQPNSLRKLMSRVGANTLNASEISQVEVITRMLKNLIGSFPVIMIVALLLLVLLSSTKASSAIRQNQYFNTLLDIDHEAKRMMMTVTICTIIFLVMTLRWSSIHPFALFWLCPLYSYITLSVLCSLDQIKWVKTSISLPVTLLSSMAIIVSTGVSERIQNINSLCDSLMKNRDEISWILRDVGEKGETKLNLSQDSCKKNNFGFQVYKGSWPNRLIETKMLNSNQEVSNRLK